MWAGPRVARVTRPVWVQVRSYHEHVLDHFSKPRNVGSMDHKDPNVGSALVGKAACGDVIKNHPGLARQRPRPPSARESPG
mmetsp:Transcript_14435/g.36516  ORF Transcript_14435/g.36516 Transcript_14435/m.36516 type:complete len:81 (-) Transcript_14435:309-551(-)